MSFEDFKNKSQQEIKLRTSGIRFRAWSLASMLALALILYLLIDVTFKDTMNWVDFLIMLALQYSLSTLFFPEGMEFGKKDPAFMQNRKRYNDKANLLIKLQKTDGLREFCQHDYEQRMKAYFDNTLGRAGITHDEFEQIKTHQRKMFKRTNDTPFIINGKEVFFNANQKKILHDFIFKPIKIEKNEPTTILSGIRTSTQKAIGDTSVAHRKKYNIARMSQYVLTALALAYIGYQFKDGINLATIVRSFIYLTTFIVAIVFSFVQGEENIKVYKNNFYIQLTNFIDRFFEYAQVNPGTEERKTDD